jgi:hypothetical protein
VRIFISDESVQTGGGLIGTGSEELVWATESFIFKNRREEYSMDLDIIL